MKIAIDTRLLNHNRRHGLFTYTEKLIYNLAKIDKDNEYFLLFTSLRKKENELWGPSNARFVKKIIRIPDGDFPFKDYIISRVILPSFLEKYKCDIFHSTFYPLLLRKRRIRYVFTIHDLKSLRIKDDAWRQNLKMYKEAMRISDAIIAISNATRKDIIEHFSVPADKIKVVYLGVSSSYKRIEDNMVLNNILRKYGITKDFFFSLGGNPRKNINRLIKSFSLFKYKNDFDLVIAGVGVNERVDEYKKLVEKYNLSGNIKILGYIKNNDDLVGLYNSAYCFVFPSLYEGFGLPVLEAMACGTPVITSNVSSLPEVGGNAVLYVDPYKEDDIARVIEKMVEDKELKNKLAEQGLERAKQFSWRRTAEETLKVYKCIN